ncbi:hypothetical protein Tco_1350415 [Tanacetum coccineum]
MQELKDLTLVNHHKIATDIWNRVKEVMEGTTLTKKERESKLYEEFDRFTPDKGESIHSYYLRYANYNGVEIPQHQPIIPPLKQHNYEPPVVQQQSPAPSTQLDSGLVVPSFLLIDYPIASLNKATMFLSTAFNSRFPPTNNQLRTLSNPRTQATIQDGRVIVQKMQG